MHLSNRHTRRVIIRHLKIQPVPPADLQQLGHETHQHPPRQIQKAVASLKAYGLVLPILVDAQNRVIDGWALVLAAQQLGLTKIPTVRISDLSDAQLRALRLALNKIPEYATWNEQELKLELSEIFESEPNIA